MAIQLDLLAENHLTQESAQSLPPLKLHLEFASLADFTPNELADKIEPLKKLLDLSQALKTTKKIVSTKTTVFDKLKAIFSDKDKKDAFLKELNDYKTAQTHDPENLTPKVDPQS
jgi:type VI secretion system protein ImpB